VRCASCARACLSTRGFNVREHEADKLIAEGEEERNIMNLILPEGTMISSSSCPGRATTGGSPCRTGAAQAAGVGFFVVRRCCFRRSRFCGERRLRNVSRATASTSYNLVRENSISAVNLRPGRRRRRVITRGQRGEFLKKRRMS